MLAFFTFQVVNTSATHFVMFIEIMILIIVDSELPVEAENAGGDERAARQEARVVQQIAGGRVVSAIDYNVVRVSRIFGELRKRRKTRKGN